MGLDFYNESEWVRQLWKEANYILGYDLKKTVFEGSEEDLKRTEITQPAVFLTEIIIYKILLNNNIRPDAVAGHSLGEYAAVVASGALDWKQGLELVKFRADTVEKVSSARPG